MNYKLNIIAGFGVLTSAALGYFFSWFALTNDYRSLVVSAAIALIYIALITLRMLVTHRASSALGFIILDLVVFTASFAYHLSLWLIISAAIAGIWLFHAWRAGRQSVNNMVIIRLPQLSRGFMASSFRAIVFLCIATYLSLVNPAELAVSRAIISSSIQNAMSRADADFMQKMIGRDIPLEETSSVTEKIITAFHTVSNRFLEYVPPQFKTALLVGLGIIIFLLISSLTTFLIPLIMGFVWCFIQLLLRVGFITIQKERVEKETITTI